MTTWDINGNVDADLPDFARDETESKRGRTEARIGDGGTKIEARDVDGDIRLAKEEKNAAATAKAEPR